MSFLWSIMSHKTAIYIVNSLGLALFAPSCYTVVTRESKNNASAKFFRGGCKQSVLWPM